VERQSVSRCWRKARQWAAEHWHTKMVPALWERQPLSRCWRNSRGWAAEHWYENGILGGYIIAIILPPEREREGEVRDREAPPTFGYPLPPSN
jgi:hypothetical protein